MGFLSARGGPRPRRSRAASIPIWDLVLKGFEAAFLYHYRMKTFSRFQIFLVGRGTLRFSPQVI